MKLLNEFQIAETNTYRKKLENPDFKLIYHKVKIFVYPQLRNNPYFGSNIKKLKGKFEGVYRYRIGNFRLFYTVNTGKVLILMINIEKRKDSYK
jgi:mRNA interferase RelE/StbE